MLGICRIKYYRSVSYIPCVWQLTCANSLGLIVSCITWLIWYLCYLFQVNNLEIHLSLVLGNDTGQLVNAYYIRFGLRSELVGRSCYRSNILTIKIYFCCQLSGICIEVIVDHQTDILAACIQTCDIHLVELANMQVRQLNHFLPVQYIQCITWLNWWYWRSRKKAAAEVDIQLIYQTDVIIHLAVADGLFCQTYWHFALNGTHCLALAIQIQGHCYLGGIPHIVVDRQYKVFFISMNIANIKLVPTRSQLREVICLSPIQQLSILTIIRICWRS